MAKKSYSNKKKMTAQQKKLSSIISAVIFIIAAIVYYWPYIEAIIMPEPEPEVSVAEPTPDITFSEETEEEETAEAEVYFFDVGQGDSILIRVGDYTMLIDASERTAGETIVQNLDALGVESLDAVIATHPHADHIGGMTMVIETFPIETFYMPVLPDKDVPTTKTYENMLDALDEENVTVKQISDETVIPAPKNAKFEVFSPYDGDKWDEMNDYSAVVRFTYGDVSFMLTGDAETPVEERILETGKDISCQILKCGHHGSSSSTSPDFLYAVDPAVAIISCAEENDYGHPHRETMATLKDYNCKIMQTWKDGTVAVITDGEKYTVNSWYADTGLQPAA